MVIIGHRFSKHTFCANKNFDTMVVSDIALTAKE